MLDPLSRPLVVRAARQALHAHAASRPRSASTSTAPCAPALQRSREGNLLARAWRELRGEQVDERSTLDITLLRSRRSRSSSSASRGRSTSRAVDASVDLECGDVTPQAVARGAAALQAGRLERAAAQAAARRQRDAKTVARRRASSSPKVSTDELAKEYPAILIVDRASFTLTLYKNLKRAKTYGIAVGQVGLETPAGLYHIQNKAVDPAWTMPNSSWVAPADRGKVVPRRHAGEPAQGALAGHLRRRRASTAPTRTASIGTAASHGCVRMLIPDVIELYDQVPVGAPVYIA